MSFDLSPQVSEGAEVGTSLLGLSATSALDASIVLAIRDGDVHSNFHLHHTTGKDPFLD